MIWVALGAYVVVALVAMRPIAGHRAWAISDSYGQEKPDNDDWSAAWMCAFVLSFLWPIAVFWLIGGKLPAIGAERAAIERRQAKKDEERLAEQAREIAELDRQLEELKNQ